MVIFREKNSRDGRTLDYLQVRGTHSSFALVSLPAVSHSGLSDVTPLLLPEGWPQLHLWHAVLHQWTKMLFNAHPYS